MNFDLKNGKIKIESPDAKNPNGDPLFEWTLDENTGEMTEVRRKPDSDSERIYERQVAPSSLINEEVNKKLMELEAQKPSFSADDKSEEESSVDWDALDMQRDIAFKIVYFFIVFIVATFGLLYAYFQMSKQEREDALR